MPNSMVTRSLLLLVLPIVVPLVASAQNVPRQPGAVYDFDRPNEKPGPAPKRDISGVWEPAKGPGAGLQGKGALSMGSCEYKTPGVPYSGYAYDAKAPVPDCLKPAKEPPYTDLGRKTLLSHVPTEGYRMVPSALTNDPFPACNPQGFPRIVLNDFRTSRIIQTPENVVILYELNKKWRVIWTDGRELPKNAEEPTWGDPDPAESRWWGYSVGKWADDYTFIAESNGFDDRTWLDNAGLPHSDALHVVEQYRRVDAVHLEMTITINDPKMYTKPWVALDKLSLRLQKASLDIPEEECAPLETEEYNKEFARPAAAGAGKTK
jgi:hypothetical protein